MNGLRLLHSILWPIGVYTWWFMLSDGAKRLYSVKSGRPLDLRLKTAIKDAIEVGKILETGYDFEVKLLRDATKEQIITEPRRYEKVLKPNSSFLLYFAGHGVYLDLGGRKEGIWQPVDAQSDNRYNWIRSTDILESIKFDVGIPDSDCFGWLFLWCDVYRGDCYFQIVTDLKFS